VAPLAGRQAAARGPAAAIARAEQDGYRHLATGLGPAPQADQRCLVLYRAVDQLRECLDKIRYQPGDRRILFHAWNPAQLEEMALPPCHLLYQFNVNAADRELSLCLYQRSVDTFLGLPWNLARAPALLTLFARLTGYRPRWLTWFGADVHLYETHLEAVAVQLTRDPLPSRSFVCRSGSRPSPTPAATSPSGWSASSPATSSSRATSTIPR